MLIGLRRSYERPYGLMPVMAMNIQLNPVVAGVFLLAYAPTLALAALLPGVP